MRGDRDRGCVVGCRGVRSAPAGGPISLPLSGGRTSRRDRAGHAPRGRAAGGVLRRSHQRGRRSPAPGGGAHHERRSGVADLSHRAGQGGRRAPPARRCRHPWQRDRGPACRAAVAARAAEPIRVRGRRSTPRGARQSRRSRAPLALQRSRVRREPRFRPLPHRRGRCRPRRHRRRHAGADPGASRRAAGRLPRRRITARAAWPGGARCRGRRCARPHAGATEFHRYPARHPGHDGGGARADVVQGCDRLGDARPVRRATGDRRAHDREPLRLGRPRRTRRRAARRRAGRRPLARRNFIIRGEGEGARAASGQDALQTARVPDGSARRHHPFYPWKDS